jgi:hypothetical protein
MSSLVSKPQQQQSLDRETISQFIEFAMFSRNLLFSNDFFEKLIDLKVASDIIQFISQLANSMKEKIQELYSEIGIQIPQEQLHHFMESPIETYNSLINWSDYFRNTLNDETRRIYRERYQNQFIHLDELIPFLKSFYHDVLFKVYIKHMTGNSIEILITHQMSIEEIKMKIQDTLGIPLDQQRLIFAGKELNDSKVSGMYNIAENANISLVLRLRGGMHHVSSTGVLRTDIDSLKEELSSELRELLYSSLDI